MTTSKVVIGGQPFTRKMIEPFLISDERLRELSGTRQGRISIAGYNYQAAYAVARLASMSVRQPVLGLQDWPVRLRYDWGEDLDEVCGDNTVVFTQCKRVSNIGQAAPLADVFVGFAAKWLWVPEAEHKRLRFRLVCSVPENVRSTKSDVLKHFVKQLRAPTSPSSDRAVWIADVTDQELLFDELWNHFDWLYLPPEIVDYEPAGPRLTAEKEGLRLLLEWNQIDPASQPQVLGRLRRLIHDNLITFDSTNQSILSPFDLSPRRLDRADVNAAIDPWRPLVQRRPPFQLVDRIFLSEQRDLERLQFVARQPDWCDVAHGYDEVIKFIERDQTEELKTEVLKGVVRRVGRSGRLPSLFVTGAPGDGKTTITRRVAALLVDKGDILIADAGVGLREPPGDPDEYVHAIERLQSFGRPVVLLLDDPLYLESPWLEILKKLNRPGLHVGLLAASPHFLFHEHKSQLRMCDLAKFEMAGASPKERESLAALYGRSVSPSEAEEDFLVVAMEAAAGEPFHEIIDRLWLTLADGRDLSYVRSLSDLPWQCRAYLFVCFFSRAYEACPEPLLQKLLKITGGAPGTSDVSNELARLKQFDGWRIFRVGERERAGLRFSGAPISAAHTVIARHAWEQRPLAWCDVEAIVIEASISVPETIHDVASLGARLARKSLASLSNEDEERDFARKLVERWRKESNVETRALCDLVSTFFQFGRPELVYPLQETLIERARPDPQGWLAASQLLSLLKRKGNDGIEATINVLSLIQAADFSIAPRRAIQFRRHVLNTDSLKMAFTDQLLSALDGQLSWELDGKLLTYLLQIASTEQLSSRVGQIKAWLEDQSEDSHVRTKYPSILLKLPPKCVNIRHEAQQMAAWLDEHPEDTTVRVQYLSFLLQLRDKHSDLRSKAAQQTAEWLQKHQEDTSVRTQYLSFLLQLPTEFSHFRTEAAQQTAEWLQKHQEDTSVRTQYLSFLLELPSGFSDFCAEAARQTAEWLQEHQEDTSVRTQFLSFLLQLPTEFSSLRANTARQTAKWLQEHQEDISVRTQYLSFLSTLKRVGEWQNLASQALNAASELITRSGWVKQHETLITASLRLHLALVSSLKSNESEIARNALKASQRASSEWCARNPSSGLQYDLPVPAEN